MPQTTVRYRPLDTVLATVLGLLGGAKTLAQSPRTRRLDPAGQRAWGRQGGAEQSTMARPLRAGTADKVAQRARVSWYDLKRYEATPHHRFDERLLWGDGAVPPLPRGAQAEGSERPWMGRNRSKTGRQPLRLSARPSRAILPTTLLRSTATAVPALPATRQEGAPPLGGRGSGGGRCRSRA